MDGKSPEDHPLRGEKRWLAAMPALKSAVVDFFNAAHEVAYHLMCGFALGLGKERVMFIKSTAMPMSWAAFVYYPPQDVELGPDQFGVGLDRDSGC